MDTSWILHGYFMDTPWILHGYSMDTPWILHGCPVVIGTLQVGSFDDLSFILRSSFVFYGKLMVSIRLENNDR
jgi:hypothetical protein